MVITTALERLKTAGLSGLLRLLTVEQWAAIDAEYLGIATSGSSIPVGTAPVTNTAQTAPGLPASRNVGSLAAQLMLVALMLTLQKYFGHRRALEELFGISFKGLPWPGLWGQVYWAWFSSLTYLLPPMLFAWFVHRETPRDYGLSLQGARQHLPLYLLLFCGVAPMVFLASGSAQFQQRYPFYQAAGNSWPELVIWELSYGFQFLALEYFFRGFMLFPLARQIGSAAIFVMVVPYCMIHFAKPFPETVGAILAGTILGTLALRTRSVLGGVLIHLAVAWSMDGLALWRKGALGQLF